MLNWLSKFRLVARMLYPWLGTALQKKEETPGGESNHCDLTVIGKRKENLGVVNAASTGMVVWQHKRRTPSVVVQRRFVYQRAKLKRQDEV